mgnify:CR=1 FL=1
MRHGRNPAAHRGEDVQLIVWNRWPPPTGARPAGWSRVTSQAEPESGPFTLPSWRRARPFPQGLGGGRALQAAQ